MTNKTYPWILVLCLTLIPASLSWAQSYPLDDSQSQVLTRNIAMHWDQWAPPVKGKDTLSTSLKVLLKLNVSAWQSKKVRIKMHVTAHQKMRVSYEGQDWLQAGTLYTGETRIIYEGIISTPLLEEMLQLKLESNAHEIINNDTLETTFSIEELS